ncbi:MAG TPA: hypothetical protein VFG47_06330 [Geminicoccaceae bacterium]|nr:hypothetical protein [Geminicoccaceae bacterium]
MRPLIFCMMTTVAAFGAAAQPAAAAGAAAGVLTVTARVVGACSVTLPDTPGRGRGGDRKPEIDHACTPGVPHRVSVQPWRPPGAAAAGPGGGRATVERHANGAGGRVVVVTITY